MDLAIITIVSFILGIANTIALVIWKLYNIIIRPKIKIIREIDILRQGTRTFYRIWVLNDTKWNKKAIIETNATLRVFTKDRTIFENKLTWSQSNQTQRNLYRGEKSKIDILIIDHRSDAEDQIMFIVEGTYRDPASGAVRYDVRHLQEKESPIFIKIEIHSLNAKLESVEFSIENPTTNSDKWNIIYQKDIPYKIGN